ncbi:hypothetical protein G9C98_003523 [Cotesia typhae]|uniref:Ig-like domain-containing protein n=1 Tax=Cotesia typhae TaxID=2053667 RepID=A0A8J5RDR1_9HYME|nr:hypothetical protein G9C98_003523 [Cotesia typhae]
MLAISIVELLSADNVPVGFPVITQSPTTKVVEMGHNAVLSCTAIGSPPPIISWIRDMVPINTSNHRYSVLDSVGKLQAHYLATTRLEPPACGFCPSEMAFCTITRQKAYQERGME